jgi:hypothetical protein
MYGAAKAVDDAGKASASSEPGVDQKGALPGKQAKFGEEVSVGDLRVSVRDVTSGECAWIWGVIGNYTRARLTVHNTSSGKIVDWSGAHTLDHTKAVDEHGNEFRTVEITGMWNPVNDDGRPVAWFNTSAFYSTRVMPGMTCESSLFFESAPPTSKELAITIDIDGTALRFRGPIKQADNP